MFFYIFTCFFIFFFLMKFLGALPQAPSAVCRNKATIFYAELTLIRAESVDLSVQQASRYARFTSPTSMSVIDVGHAAFHECHGTDDGDECRLVVPIE